MHRIENYRIWLKKSKKQFTLEEAKNVLRQIKTTNLILLLSNQKEDAEPLQTPIYNFSRYS